MRSIQYFSASSRCVCDDVNVAVKTLYFCDGANAFRCFRAGFSLPALGDRFGQSLHRACRQIAHYMGNSMGGSCRVSWHGSDSARLRVIRAGEASCLRFRLSDRFDPETSDVDFVVTFRPGRENLFHDYSDLKFELERIIGPRVDLAMERSVKHPFFKASAFGETQTSMRPEVGAHLWNAAEAARLVQEVADGMTEVEFISDLLIRSAIERQLEIPREARGARAS